MRVVGFAIVATLLAVTTGTAGARSLTAQEIADNFIGHTARWLHFVPLKNSNTDVYLSRKGDMVATSPEGDIINTKFKINYQEDVICFGSRTNCMLVVEEGDHYSLRSPDPSETRAVATITDVRSGDFRQLYANFQRHQQMNRARAAAAMLQLLKVGRAIGEAMGTDDPVPQGGRYIYRDQSGGAPQAGGGMSAPPISPLYGNGPGGSFYGH